jgi:hypothetical protein
MLAHRHLDATAASREPQFDKTFPAACFLTHFLNRTYTICVADLEFFAEHPERIAEFSK